MGTIFWQRAPDNACGHANFLADRVVAVADPVMGRNVEPFSTIQYWVWDADVIPGRAPGSDRYGAWDTGSDHVWLERCLIGLVHESLHIWDVRVQGVPGWQENHDRWDDLDTQYKDLDAIWQYHAQVFWCVRPL